MNPSVTYVTGLFGNLVVCVLFAENLQNPPHKTSTEKLLNPGSRNGDVLGSRTPDPHRPPQDDDRLASFSSSSTPRKQSMAVGDTSALEHHANKSPEPPPHHHAHAAVTIDPYCSLKVVGLNGSKSKVQHTCTRKKTNNPRWDEVIQFNVMGGDKLDIEVRAKSIFQKSVLLATGSVSLHDLLDGQKHDITVSLLPAGTIALRLQFFDESCLFGLPIADVCARERTNIPLIISRIVAEIDRRGLDETGLYRVSGRAVGIQKLKEEFIIDAASAPVRVTFCC